MGYTGLHCYGHPAMSLAGQCDQSATGKTHTVGKRQLVHTGYRPARFNPHPSSDGARKWLKAAQRTRELLISIDQSSLSSLPFQ